MTGLLRLYASVFPGTLLAASLSSRGLRWLPDTQWWILPIPDSKAELCCYLQLTFLKQKPIHCLQGLQLMYKQDGTTVRGQRDSLLSISSLGVVNTREGEKLFKLQNNVGTRTNGSELAMNKCKLEIRRIFLTLSTVRLGNSLPIGGKKLNWV